MKKQPIKNIRSKVIFISLAIISSFLFIINFIPLFVENEGITTKFTKELSSYRGTYVNRSNPDMNYYNFPENNVIIGNSCEAFIHFNLQLLPKETEDLYFSIGYYHSYLPFDVEIEDVEINLILIESSWNFSKLTWNNKPKHEEIIDTVNASEIRQYLVIESYDLEKTVKLTEIYKENKTSEIRFCINITENNVELNTSVILPFIMIIYSYEKLLISYITITSSIIIFFMLIGTIYYIRKEIFFCSKCHTKRKLTERFCSSCGINIKNEKIIKGSIYQLIIISLWIFAFFEVFFIYAKIIEIFYYPFLPIGYFILIGLWVIFCVIQIIRRLIKYKELRNFLRKSKEF